MPVSAKFQRAALDRNMTVDTEIFKRSLNACHLEGLALIDFGCGTGNLLRLLRDSDADVIYAFEVVPQDIAPDIIAWSQDENAKPRLIINPPEFKFDAYGIEGDLTNYDYFALLAGHQRFGIIGNPPYFLYNRVLSLTGNNLADGNENFTHFAGKFAGALMITSAGRLRNHPGWIIKGVMNPDDFDPPAGNLQYVVQTGFAVASAASDVAIPQNAPAQKYVSINNRMAEADESDAYPEMWAQLDSLKAAVLRLSIH
ncbi:MAG TPA: hypothetical protein VIN59_06895 [Alphaproteobacteria bacterium]